MLCVYAEKKTSASREEIVVNSDCSLVLPMAVASTSPSWKFQVLFSLREEETCNKFTDHLYTTFKGSGLTVFTD